MIVVPSNEEEVTWCRNFLLARGHIEVTASASWLVWEREGMPQWVVAFDSWVGTTCQMHMASQGAMFWPRSLMRVVFQHGFVALKRTHLFGLVNSNNPAAMRIDTWLGFREVYRVPKVHDDGGDLVIFEMTPADCRWLRD